MSEVAETLEFRAEAKARDAARRAKSTVRTRTMGRTDVTYARRRSCPICKQRIEWGARYRWDSRVDVCWHVECEQNTERFARLTAKIATMPTIMPTFPRTTSG